jgi:transposase
MGKQYKPWTPEQPFLLPPSPLEWLPEGHLAHFILDVVGELDLSAIEQAYQAKDARGTRPYNPVMMTALLLYGYCVGVFSSRKLERATYEDVAFRVLGGGNHPDHSRIARFRREHLEALRGLFLQVLKLCQKAGLVTLGHVAIDGTKIEANASKHKAMSYKRMLEIELRLQEEIDQLLARAEEVDASDDARFGVGCREEDLPTELRRREQRLARIREAKAQLEAEAAEARARSLREQAQRARERSKQKDRSASEQKRAATSGKNKAAKARELAPDRDDDDVDPPATREGLPLHEPRVNTDGTPDDSAQMNFTDPDSRILESSGGFVQGYNCQAAVDDAHQVIVAQAVSNQSPDNGNLVPMVAQVRANCDAAPTTATADAGYWRADASVTCSELGTEAYISTERRKHWDANDTVTEGPPPEELNAREQMRHKVRTEDGRAIYARRKAVVEPVFGQTKEGRGFRRFHLRGLAGAAGEWALACTGHNLLKLFRFHKAARIAA